jgi:hypothetical protein
VTGTPARKARLSDRARQTVSGLIPNVRSFLWGVGAVNAVRRDLKAKGSRTRVLAPRAVGPRGTTGVRIAVTVARPTCLERALVLQGWISGYSSSPPDVVIGVRKHDGVVEAHAWVDGSDPEFDATYEELTRLTL